VRFRGDRGSEGGVLLTIEDRPTGSRTCIWSVTAIGSGAAIWRCGNGFVPTRPRGPAAQLKGRLAAQFSGDRRAYTATKAAFIQQLLSAN